MTSRQKTDPKFNVRLAKTPADLHAAQRLRYEVFVAELGADGPLTDHKSCLERDRLDPFCEHLLLCDAGTDDVVGVYRLMQSKHASAAGGFYSAAEFDLTLLEASGRRLLELGRSCLHPDVRGGIAMHTLWSALAQYVIDHQIELLFGVASFHGTDVNALAEPLSLLHHRHLAPASLRPVANGKPFQSMNLIDELHLNRRVAMLQIPSLIKAYLRLGGCVGEGAFIDTTFNTVDVCLVLDTQHLNARQAGIYSRGQT